MIAEVVVRNLSMRKGLHRTPTLTRLAERVCAGENARPGAEISVMLCDDVAIQELNRQYRGVNKPTDVLSFEQPAPAGAADTYLLGDVVISLETVERLCDGERPSMRAEVLFLFCHGLLHLLGYDHATRTDERNMRSKQAHYLGISADTAWRDET